jgi:hypothetical protein
MHIVELSKRLQEKDDCERIRPYSASTRCQKDIEHLSKILNDSEIS